jgi:hypothetical protein
MYRLMARMKSIPRFVRYRFGRTVQYHRYGSGVYHWRGWYEDRWGCLAFVDLEGNLVFSW